MLTFVCNGMEYDLKQNLLVHVDYVWLSVVYLSVAMYVVF